MIEATHYLSTAVLSRAFADCRAFSGIGRAVAIAFALECADVMICYLNEDDDAIETARWVKKAGQEAIISHGRSDRGRPWQ